VLGVSQSGQSPDIVTVLRAARDQGRPTVALTNDPESPLAAEADVVVPLLAGPERSVAATKTYTTTLHAFVQLAVAMGATGLDADLVRLPDLVEQTVAHAFESSPDLVSAVLTSGSGRVDVLPLTAVGRGTGFATASETALKIREVAGVRAESYSVPDLLHGPVAANGPGSTAWVICSPGHPAGYWDDVLARLVSGNVHVVALTTEGRERLVPTSVSLPPDMASWAFDFVAVLLGQVTALRLGEMRSLDVDRPPGLRKVTRTA
jgi:glucosamine--fructose-6-phosphate aminotransferase (isomerizing)